MGGSSRGQGGDSPSVRGSHPELAAAITDAAEQSPTFRQLVTAIRSAGGLVYVHHGMCGRTVRACLLLNITQAGPFRLLNIRIDQRKKGRELMIAIGHELRHVLEVLNEPSAVDANSVRIFYERITPTQRMSFETQAAIEAERKIEGELRAYASVVR